MAKSMLSISTAPCNNFTEVFATNNAILNNKCPACHFRDGPYPELDTIVGLGFTAILTEGSEIDVCSTHIETYICFRDFYHYGSAEILSATVSEIVSVSIRAFKKLGHPSYYNDFIWAIYRVISTDHPIPIEIKQAIEKILK